MKIHKHKQNTPEWDEFRLHHFGASEAAAMLGLSPKVKRNELLRMKKTGTAKQFSAWVQEHILDPGHVMEGDARPIVEQSIGEALYPVTVSEDEGRISASCDGLTIDDRVAFEHKRWNKEYAEIVRDGRVPDEHMPQCQQVLMVTGAEYLIFVISDGTEENMEAVEVYPDPEWFDRLRAGWAQFELDLETYVPTEPAPKVEAKPIKALPALFVQLRGEVTESNLAVYREAADAFIATLSTDLKTEEDFVQAAANVKFCDEAERQLALVKTQALSQTASVAELFNTIDHISSQLAQKRIAIDKLVEAEKTARKARIAKKGKDGWAEHIAKLEAEIAPLELVFPAGVVPDFAAAAKNKRTPESLQDAIDTALANGKIAADAFAGAVRAKLTEFATIVDAPTDDAPAGYRHLFSDLQGLIAKPADDFRIAVKARIEDHVAREAAAAEKRKAAAEVKPVEQPAAAPAPILETVAAASPSPAVFTPRPAANQAENADTITLGQIATRLGFALTADFLKTLGFEPAAKLRGAVHFYERDLPRIGAALINHIQAAISEVRKAA